MLEMCDLFGISFINIWVYVKHGFRFWQSWFSSSTRCNGRPNVINQCVRRIYQLSIAEVYLPWVWPVHDPCKSLVEFEQDFRNTVHILFGACHLEKDQFDALKSQLRWFEWGLFVFVHVQLRFYYFNSILWLTFSKLHMNKCI